MAFRADSLHMVSHAPGRDFCGLNVRTLLELVEWRLGEDGVEAVLLDAGERRPLSDLREDTTWHSYDQLRALLEAGARHLGGVDELLTVGDLPTIKPGTMPEITALLQAFGSPIKLAESTTHGAGALYPIVKLRSEGIGETHLRLTFELHEGFEPYPELCAFISGLMPLSVRLFGLRPHELEHTSCQCRGDEACVTEVKWDETEDLTMRLEHMTLRMEVAEMRLEMFRETVRGIVSVDDLDALLQRVAAAAARSTTVTWHILMVDEAAGRARLYTDGISPDEAQALAEQAVAGDPNFRVVEIASGTNVYGRFVLPDPSNALDLEMPVIEAYARLAAQALDSAVALEQARRQAATTNALLELSRSLADLVTSSELAERVVDAMPAVLDCDVAAVLLVHDSIATVAAHRGFPLDAAHRLAAFELELSNEEVGEVSVYTRDDTLAVPAPFLAAFRLEAIASTPLLVEGRLLGYLVAGVFDQATRLSGDRHLAERFGGLAGQAAVALRNKELMDEIRHQARHDSLTGLPNRAFILERAEQLLALSKRHDRPCAALFLDLDGFKEINDTLGHAAGDEVLQIVASRLRMAVRASDTVGRLGGDEFVVLADDRMLDSGIQLLAERLLEVVRRPFTLGIWESPLQVRASIGIALGDRPTAGDLLRDADLALYRAKAAGKDCFRVFGPESALTR